MMSHTFVVPFETQEDYDRVSEIRAWLRQNVNCKLWNVYTTQRSKVHEFILFRNKDAMLFMLKWS